MDAQVAQLGSQDNTTVRHLTCSSCGNEAGGVSCPRPADCPHRQAKLQADLAAAQALFDSRYLSAKALAELDGVTRQGVQWAHSNGKIPLPIKIEGLLLWERTPDLQRAIDTWRRVIETRRTPVFA